jgi:hypothetical protein
MSFEGVLRSQVNSMATSTVKEHPLSVRYCSDAIGSFGVVQSQEQVVQDPPDLKMPKINGVLVHYAPVIASTQTARSSQADLGGRVPTANSASL